MNSNDCVKLKPKKSQFSQKISQNSVVKLSPKLSVKINNKPAENQAENKHGKQLLYFLFLLTVLKTELKE